MYFSLGQNLGTVFKCYPLSAPLKIQSYDYFLFFIFYLWDENVFLVRKKFRYKISCILRLQPYSIK